jgi:hypothetical protein
VITVFAYRDDGDVEEELKKLRAEAAGHRV